MQTLDRASPVPLWAQLAADLRERIGRGEFGERLPTEAQLLQEYDVSRHTVREAVRGLKDAGLLRAQRGRGTTIATSSELEQSLHGLYSLSRSVQTAGLRDHSDVLVHERRPAGEVAGVLEVPDDAEVLFIERIRYAGDEPLAQDRSWLPWDLGRRLRLADLEHGSLYDALLQRAGVVVTGGNERIRPAVPDAPTRARLALPRGRAVFDIERVAVGGGRPVELRRSQVRGDRYSFVARW